MADSAQFSAVAPPHAVGTALTLQTSLGFLLTAGSIWLAVEMSGRFGWGPAFSLLTVGPALGIGAMLRLKSIRPGWGENAVAAAGDRTRDDASAGPASSGPPESM